MTHTMNTGITQARWCSQQPTTHIFTETTNSATHFRPGLHGWPGSSGQQLTKGHATALKNGWCDRQRTKRRYIGSSQTKTTTRLHAWNTHKHVYRRLTNNNRHVYLKRSVITFPANAWRTIHTLITFCHKVAHMHLELWTKDEHRSPMVLQRHLKDAVAQ